MATKKRTATKPTPSQAPTAKRTVPKKTASRKTSTKRAETKTMDRGLKNTLWGIVFLALALLSFLSFFDGVIGVVGTGLRIAMSWAMGATAAGIPVLFLLLAITRIVDRYTAVSKQGLCIIGLYVTVSALWSAIAVDLNGMALPEYLSVLATKGVEMSGGGVLTGIFSWIFLSLFNKIGTIIVFIVVILILLVIISGVTFSSLFDRTEEDEEKSEQPAPETKPIFLSSFRVWVL